MRQGQWSPPFTKQKGNGAWPLAGGPSMGWSGAWELGGWWASELAAPRAWRCIFRSHARDGSQSAPKAPLSQALYILFSFALSHPRSPSQRGQPLACSRMNEKPRILASPASCTCQVAACHNAAAVSARRPVQAGEGGGGGGEFHRRSLACLHRASYNWACACCMHALLVRRSLARSPNPASCVVPLGHAAAALTGLADSLHGMF